MSDKKIEKTEYQEISLFKNPIETLTYLVKILSEQIFKFIHFLLTNRIVLLLTITYAVLNFFPGPTKEVKYHLK
jgi:hypothetical protein